MREPGLLCLIKIFAPAGLEFGQERQAPRRSITRGDGHPKPTRALHPDAAFPARRQRTDSDLKHKQPRRSLSCPTQNGYGSSATKSGGVRNHASFGICLVNFAIERRREEAPAWIIEVSDEVA